jgi:hypothetical protein
MVESFKSRTNDKFLSALRGCSLSELVKYSGQVTCDSCLKRIGN